MFVFFFFKQKTAYELRISDWSSDVCSSDLHRLRHHELRRGRLHHDQHAGHAEGHGPAGAGARRAPGDRGLRHRPPAARQVAEGSGPDRRPGGDPALHGHPLRAPDDMATLMAMTATLPADWVFSAFSIG